MKLKKILLITMMLAVSASDTSCLNLRLLNLACLRMPHFHINTQHLLRPFNQVHYNDLVQNVRSLLTQPQRYITSVPGGTSFFAVAAGFGGHFLLPLWLNPGALGLGLLVYTYLSQSGLSHQVQEVGEDVHKLQQTTDDNHKENQKALTELRNKADEHKAATDAGFTKVDAQLAENHKQTNAKLEQLQTQQAETNNTVQTVQKTTNQTYTIVLATQRKQEQLKTDVSKMKQQNAVIAAEVKKMNQNIDSFKASTEESFKGHKEDITNLDNRAEQRHKQTQKDLATLTYTVGRVIVGVDQVQKTMEQQAEKQNQNVNKILDQIQEAKDRAVALEITLEQQFGILGNKLDVVAGAVTRSSVKADASSWQNGKAKKLAPNVPSDDAQMQSGKSTLDDLD